MKRALKSKALVLYSVAAGQFGIDVIKFFTGFVRLPYFLASLWKFRRIFRGEIELNPYLHDRFQQAGEFDGEYFWQDLTVARWIFENEPLRHADIGSRFDGFVAHVASFRPVSVIDIRPFTDVVPNVDFVQCDLMSPEFKTKFGKGAFDSVSCLHAMEHFGLGRYGDPLIANGYERAFANIAHMIAGGGRLYLSVPVGRERVVFNSHWVFDPLTIIEAGEAVGLKAEKLHIFDRKQRCFPEILADVGSNEVRKSDYTLGIFTFSKT